MYVAPSQTLNETMRRNDGVKTNAQYRKFMQSNSAHLRGYNKSTAELQVAAHTTSNNTVANETSDLKEWFMQRNF